MNSRNEFSPGAPLPRWVLYLVVFLCGAVVMILELGGARQLAPAFGQGLYVWSALITITLLGLAVGYRIGGRIADRWPSARTLFFVFLGIAAWILILAPFQAGLMYRLQALGPRLGALVAGAFLVLPPLTGLGMVNPFAVRLRIRKTEEAGNIAGTVAAVSTAGSLVGAILTGFWLIPWLGIKFLFLASGFCMMALAYLTALWGYRKKEPPLIPGVVLLILFILGVMYPEPPIYYGKNPVPTLIIKESNYGQVGIAELGDLRAMFLNGALQSLMKQKDQISYVHYTHGLVRLVNSFRGQSRKVLVIGLGGGAIPIFLERQGFEVTAVDIDPVVVELARKYMGLEKFRGKIVVEDARLFLNRTTEKYGAIVLDAFSADAPPFHLSTLEAFAACKDRLDDDGILVMNYICATAADGRKPLAGILTSLRHVFPEVRAYGEANTTIPENVFIVAGQALNNVPDSARFKEVIPTELEHKVNLALTHALDIGDAVPPVTDDKYWLDLYDYRARLAARHLKSGE
ncbi:MAG: fused MFS/spermidine synthase [bacterium]